MIIKGISPVKGEFRENEFLLPIRVYYEDTDAGGIVYYANYLKFAERARTEFLRALGVRQQDKLETEDKAGFIVRSCNIEYLAPAVLDDELMVSCRILDFSGASATMHQEVTRDDQVLVSMDVKVVYLNINTKKPTRIPRELAAKISQYM